MRVLVTGVGGLIGSNVAAAAAQQSWEAIGCYRGQAVELDGVQTIAVDLAERNQCVAAAMEFDPDVIVHAAGGVALSRFELEPRLAELDYLATEHTIAAARAVRARYVLVSCDWVYSGYRPAGSRFAESDAPAPVNAYGRSKLACEQATMRANLPWLIARPADVYGVNVARPLHQDSQEQGGWERGMRKPGVGTHDGLWERGMREHGLDAHDGLGEQGVWARSGPALRLAGRLCEGAVLPAPRGLWRSPTYAWDFAQRSCELIAQGCEGVYNMGGAVPLGRYEWLGLLASAFDCERGLVQEGTVEGFLRVCGEDPELELPSNTALSGEKASGAIGSPAVAPESGLRLMREQLRRMLKPVRGLAR
ncbi:MAG TPA: sugar nucleotide-binding protein [Solirubrobacteraceae bacterium]|jgi:dTDP-4-dehydrorhamnose reductase|nr:sugar nucleotide-binding protein [Solirubrobacteraceae bacterium]